jgi:hypothetical protein
VQSVLCDVVSASSTKIWKEEDENRPYRLTCGKVPVERFSALAGRRQRRYASLSKWALLRDDRLATGCSTLAEAVVKLLAELAGALSSRFVVMEPGRNRAT